MRKTGERRPHPTGLERKLGSPANPEGGEADMRMDDLLHPLWQILSHGRLALQAHYYVEKNQKRRLSMVARTLERDSTQARLDDMDSLRSGMEGMVLRAAESSARIVAALAEVTANGSKPANRQVVDKGISSADELLADMLAQQKDLDGHLTRWPDAEEAETMRDALGDHITEVSRQRDALRAARRS